MNRQYYTPPVDAAAMLAMIAGNLTRMGRVSESVEDGQKQLVVDAYHEANFADPLVFTQDEPGRPLLVPGQGSGWFGVLSPAHLLEHYCYQPAARRPKADPRIVKALSAFDATTLYSLRGGGTRAVETYDALRALGPDAAIHRFLAQAPMFGSWLEWHTLDPYGTSEGQPILSGLHAAEDPRAWIHRQIARAHRTHWPDEPASRSAVRAIVDCVIAHGSDLPYHDVTPASLAFLALVPKRHRPRDRDSLAKALDHATRTHVWASPLNQFLPSGRIAMLTGDWQADHRALAGLRCSLDWSGRHHSVLRHILGAAVHPVDTRVGLGLSETITHIIEIRLRRVCEPGRRLSDLLEALDEIRCQPNPWQAEPVTDGQPYWVWRWMSGRYLPETLRGLKPSAFLRALGFDVEAIAQAYTDPRDWTEAALQAAILQPALHSRRFTRQSQVTPITVFHTATLNGATYYARMTAKGPVITSDALGDKRLFDYGPEQYALPPRKHDDTPMTVQTAFHAAFGHACRLEASTPLLAHDFYASAAAQGLRHWVSRHPKTAQAFARTAPACLKTPALGDWIAWTRTPPATPLPEHVEAV